MLERCHRIKPFIRSGRDAFMASKETQDAVIRNVEVIGEAGKRVSAEARTRLPELDWKAVGGMGDVLIHDCIGADLDEVWNVTPARMPELQGGFGTVPRYPPTNTVNSPMTIIPP
jgi:uncharacterized protein with HEPN domain